MPVESMLNEERIKKYTLSGLWGNRNFPDYFNESVHKYPDKTAVVGPRGNRLTYRELNRLSDRVALGLLHMGIKKEDIATVQLPNCVEIVYIYLALAKIGVIFNPVPATYRNKEIEYIINFSESKIVIIPDVFRRFNYVEMLQELRPNLSSAKHFFVIGENVGEGMLSFSELEKHPWEKEYSPDILEKNKPGANDILGLLYTSGTEAQPKGVLHTHNTIISGEIAFAERLKMSSDDVCFMPSPLAHATGFAHGMTLPFLLGQTSVSLDIWEPENALKLMEKERCTYSMGATPFVRTLLDCPNFRKYDIRSMRYFLCGGAPVPKDLIIQGTNVGLRILPVYGLTESIPHVAGNPDDPPEKVYGTDGKPCPGIEVKIKDENRKDLPNNEIGEEVSRGPNVCVGYFKRPDLNEKSFDEEGFFYSGDLALLDNDGNLIIRGRKKDIIIRGGQNINVKEVEDLLLNHPKVYNVAIVGMPDVKMGEKSCAYIIPRPNETVTLDDVTSFLREKKIALFKLPERVEMIDDFPMTPSGKVQKYVLRNRIARKIEQEAQGSFGDG
ncbi:MAG: AMP-binding protein [Thermodesulfobacteriota bacterium]